MKSVVLVVAFSISAAAAARTDHQQAKPKAPRTAAVIAQVPEGMYVRSNNPPCGVQTNLSSLGKDPNVMAAVGKTMGPKAAAVVLLVSKADEVASKSGGDLAGLWNKATGKKDGASCAAMCVRLPSGAKPTAVELSDRHGVGGHKKPFVDGSIAVDAPIDDWSGWRDVVSAKANGRWLVCGTATNWSHDQIATKRMAVVY
jgi:hypothetical protein